MNSRKTCKYDFENGCSGYRESLKNRLAVRTKAIKEFYTEYIKKPKGLSYKEFLKHLEDEIITSEMRLGIDSYMGEPYKNIK